MSKTVDSLMRLKIERGASDQEFTEGLRQITDVRSKKYLERLKQKYGWDLVHRAWRWINDNLSPLEIQAMSGEQWVIRYLEENLQECTSEEIAKALGRDQVKKLIHNFSDDEVIPENLVWDQEGKIADEKSPKKGKAKLPPIPSEKKMKEMTSEDMKKIIDAYAALEDEE